MLHRNGIWLLILACMGLESKEYTLEDLVELTQLFPENAKMDDITFDHPDFSSFLETQRGGFYKRFLRFFGYKSKDFPIEDLAPLIKDVTETQEKFGRSGEFILATELSLNDKIIIFGVIQGAFHSLVRDLLELKRQGIIDSSLKVINPHDRIIFNGTVVARSPFILQTLFVVLLLMKKNPDNVFYIKSDFEENQRWASDGFMKELDILYKSFSKDISDAFKRLVSVLPISFYGNYRGSENKLLKITSLKAFKQDQTDTLENETGNFFYRLKPEEISVWTLDKKEESEKRVHASVIIDGSDPEVINKSIEPIEFLEPLGSASVWRTFSAASSFFYKLYQFTDDSFVKIVCGKILNSSIIELYVRNRFTQESFRLKESFEINLGTPLAATADNLNFFQKQIFIGSSLDLSKSNLIMGDRVRTGILLGIKQANASSEMAGLEIKDVILDDWYVPSRARKNVELLQKDFNIDTLLIPVGTPTLLAVQDLVVSGSILAAFPISGSLFWRRPETKGVVNYRPSYILEVEKLIDYLTKEYSFKIFAFFYQEDEYGMDCMEKAREILKSKGIEKWIELPYPRNTTDFSRQKDLLKNEQVEALGCFSTSQPTQEFLRQVGAASLASVKVFALAFAVDDTFEAFVNKELGLKCLFSRCVPNPKLSKLGIVEEYRHLMDELKKPYDVYSLESYICTTLLCDMIKKNPHNVSHVTLLAQFEALNNYDLKGLTFTFNPTDRQISKRIWFDFQDGSDWLEIL